MVPLVSLVLAIATVWPGLGPGSLFLDDEWVALALREASLGERLGLHLPMPVGFAVLAGLPGAFLSDPLALQLLPVLAYLASVALFPVLVYRLTRNVWATTLGAALLASAPLTANLAVRVKHYTLDQLVTVGVLLVLTWLFQTESSRRFVAGTAILGLGVLLSFSSVFLSVAALGTACVAVWTTERERSYRTVVTVATGVFMVAVGAFFVLYVRHASRPIMVEFWTDYFPAFDGVGGVASFLSERVWAFLVGAVPGGAAPVVLLAPLGLVWLWRSGHRAYSVALAGFYAAVLAAAAVRAYPIGTGRTDTYAFAVTTLLVCLGGVLLLERISSRPARQALYGGLVALVALTLAASPGARYPASQGRPAVEWVLERLDGDDALVLSPYAVFALAYYGDTPAELVPADYYGHGFDVAPERPRTFTSALGRWDLRSETAAQAELARLDAFVADGPERLVYLATYGTASARALVVNTILAHRYVLTDRTDLGGVGEAFLFERADAAP